MAVARSITSDATILASVPTDSERFLLVGLAMATWMRMGHILEGVTNGSPGLVPRSFPQSERGLTALADGQTV